MKNFVSSFWEQVPIATLLKWCSAFVGTVSLLVGISIATLLLLYFSQPSKVAETDELYVIVVLSTVVLLLFAALMVVLSLYVHWRSKAIENGNG